MIVVIKDEATPQELQAIEQLMAGSESPHYTRLDGSLILSNERPLQQDTALRLLEFASVERVLKADKAYRLVSREFRPAGTIIRVGDAVFGGDEAVAIAGPCSVESEDQILRIAAEVKEGGAKVLRGGAFKPRTSPYAFQGLGERGLELLAKAREASGLPIVTEVLDAADLPLVASYADILQVGSRNMKNYKLLKAVAASNKPILLKRGMASHLEELLLSAEYIMAGGNGDIILCERGVRTFTDYARNTLDLNIVPTIKKATHLPIIVDPSHGTGIRDLVAPMSMAAIACGADGLMIEVHTEPDRSWSDAAQAISPENFADIMHKVRSLSAWRTAHEALSLTPEG